MPDAPAHTPPHVFIETGVDVFICSSFPEDIRQRCQEKYETLVQNGLASDDTVYICQSWETLEELLKDTTTLGQIVMSSTPEDALDALIPPHISEDIPVLTIVAECRFLHKSMIAESVSQKLYEHGYLDSDTTHPYRLVFQEGLLNAIEHGNLGLSSIRDKTKDSADWFDNYYTKVKHVLENTAAGQGLIRIFVSEEAGRIHTRIVDVGEGFDTDTAYAGMDIENPYGKGLSLAAALSEHLKHEQGGRCFYACMNTHSQMSLKLPDRNTAKDLGRILIVDDQKVNRDISEHFLKKAGYRYIETAENGRIALEKVRTFKPDLIMMDVMMPEMDGFEACQALKSMQATRHIPVLFLSGLTDAATRTKGYQLGAVDYVNKPIDRHEMVVRADVHILNGMMYKFMREYAERIQEDLTDARTFQLELLPHIKEIKSIEQSHNVLVESDYRPTEELAGDYWTILKIDEKRLGIAMVDFTGHGVKAALNTIRLHAIFEELTLLMADPVSFAYGVNQRLKDALQIGNFATFFYGVLDTRSGQLDYISCGAPPAFIIPAHMEEDMHMLHAAGVPLGLLPDDELEIEHHTAQLKAGDTLFTYSDALTETMHKNGEMWEDEGLIKILENNRTSLNNNSPMRDVLRHFHRTAHKPLKDDLTLLSVKLQSEVLEVADAVFDEEHAGLF